MTSGSLPDFDASAVWAEAARILGEHRASGRGHLLTEDTLRLCVIQALEGSGISPDRLSIEINAPALPGGKVDLAIGGVDGTVDAQH